MASRTSNTPMVVAIVAGALALVAITAVAATYMGRPAAETPKQVTVIHDRPNAARYANAQPAAGQAACDDKNIVGTVGGAVAGGVVGNQFGKGHGRTAATVGGALGGAYLGNEYLPTRNVTCR